MALPLPYVVPDEDVQSNFDAISKEFPLSRKNLKIESPHVVGAAGEPAFENGWVNFGSGALTYEGARFWKDPTGRVHLEGMVKSGTLGLAATGVIFTLPVGYRPGNSHQFAVVSNSLFGQAAVASDGKVYAIAGNNASFTLSGISFKQEK